ncbi:MAG: glycosyl hydrolase family 43 [Sphingobacteriaceae bacterium]|nr:MAG: glycosyl hydrolase family 43 [Sphingobacteriaceae bacterium]
MKPIKLFQLYSLVVLGLFASSCSKEHGAAADPTGNADSSLTFTNPVKDAVNNAFVTRFGDKYYVLANDDIYVSISEVKNMEYYKYAYTKTIYAADPKSAEASASANITSPELYQFDGKWYVYFAADKDGLAGRKRIYVLENSDPNPLSGTWAMKGKIADSGNDFLATDGTVLEYKNQRYFIWSGWKSVNPLKDSVQQNLYIAKMASPVALEGARVKISEPTYSWEKTSYNFDTAGKVIVRRELLNQNPQVLKNTAGDVFLTYTASACRTENMAIGLLTLKKDGDPLNPADWQKTASPVFSSNGENAYGPGFNSFFKSPNGAEDWIAYDASRTPGGNCGSGRNIRIQKFSWKVDGSPDFGTPASTLVPLFRPAKN